jgi:hypothetical protein
MWSHEELTARLPGPLDDEPPTLRQRIVAEIADHLECALRRELLRTGDESVARRRVLERFGNPALVVRRLWFDALWEQIMSQRILATCCVLLTTACLAGVVLAWRVSSEVIAAVNRSAEGQREFAEGLKLLSDAVAESSRANKEMVNALSEMRPASGALESGSGTVAVPEPRAVDRVPLKVRVTQGTKDGPPRQGVLIQVSHQQRDNTAFESKAFTDTNGVADMGFVLRTAAVMSIEATCVIDGVMMVVHEDIEPPILEPEKTVLISCPEKIPEAADFRFAPVRFRDTLPSPDEIAVLYVFERTSWRRNSSGRNEWEWRGIWNPQEKNDAILRARSADTLAFLVTSDGQVQQVVIQHVEPPPGPYGYGGENTGWSTFSLNGIIYAWKHGARGFWVSPLESMPRTNENRQIHEFARTEGKWNRCATFLVRTTKPQSHKETQLLIGVQAYTIEDRPYEVLAATDDGVEERAYFKYAARPGIVFGPYDPQMPMVNLRSIGVYVSPEPEFAGEKATFEMMPGENPPIPLPFPAGFVEVAKAALAEAKPAAESGEAAVER